jgi:ADP-ribose diphosphatase
MREKPICTQRKVIAKSQLFTIEQIDLEFANGEKRIYERVVNRGLGAVLIVGVTANQSVLLIREYAAGIDAYEWAFPKGLIDTGETAIVAANRELREEVGMAARQLDWLKSMTIAPGYFGARIDLIVARDLYQSPLVGDEPEPIEVMEWPLARSDELLLRPDFSEARSIAALLVVKQWLEGKNNE